MTDRKVTVNEADLRAVLGEVETTRVQGQARRILDALDALGPEPCGHPSQNWLLGAPRFRCVAPKGHHEYAGGECPDHCTAYDQPHDPIHCAAKHAHVPPADVWKPEPSDDKEEHSCVWCPHTKTGQGQG